MLIFYDSYKEADNDTCLLDQEKLLVEDEFKPEDAKTSQLMAYICLLGANGLSLSSIDVPSLLGR